MADNKQQAKRVDIISLKMVRESSFLYQQRKISSPGDAAFIMRSFLEESDRERFCVLCLDTKNQPSCIATVSIGTLNSSLVHPRETFQIAIMANSAAVILSHNHPSGDPTPSREDIQLTKRLAEAGELLDISVLDHIVIGSDGKYVSLKEKGLF